VYNQLCYNHYTLEFFSKTLSFLQLYEAVKSAESVSFRAKREI